jgi:asparagine synthase (glutamine-hydrolysing)
MCGWNVVWETRRRSHVATAELKADASRMAAALVHRGPDDAGLWVDDEAGLALGFRRLAILDLSADGRQPMRSASGRYVIAFNGEVYNFRELRAELEPLGHQFRGHSDTEVMLAAIEQWGLDAAVRRFVGMFAFALWDRQTRSLSLARDRLGKKPLYYGRMGQNFLCGSELKALRTHPAFTPRIDRGALMLFMRHGYIPTPHSIYEGIFQLPPGCRLTLPSSASDVPSPTPYWSLASVAEQADAHDFSGTEVAMTDQLDLLLREAVRLRMVADVPLGAFLSGGVDSSTIVALMQVQSSRPVKTFTIGFAEAAYDEANYARAVAQHLGTQHTELYVTPAQAQSVIPRLPSIFDEPFADPSQIPTFLVSELARQHVTVSLSGDGGDELFGGYARYPLAQSLWHRIQHVPLPIRKTASQLITAIAPQTYDHWLGRLAPLTRLSGYAGSVGDKVHKLAGVLPARTSDDLYQTLISHWRLSDQLVLGAEDPPVALGDASHHFRAKSFIEQMMFADTLGYLPGDILTKVDRASMAVSLEARVPMLDHRVVEFAWHLPLDMKRRDGHGKWILRQVLRRYVPDHLIERPKMGFGVPIDIWLRGPLRDWAEALLNERRLREDGFLNPAAVRQKWSEHTSGERNWQYQLWNVLMFQAWLDRWERHDAEKPMEQTVLGRA